MRIKPPRHSKAKRQSKGAFEALGVTVLCAAFAFLSPSVTRADSKLEISTGLYSLTAKTTKKTGSVSGPGLYRAAYSYGFGNQFEFQLGYTLFMSSVITGDLGYGPDLGALYYPMTDTGVRKVSNEKLILSVEDVVRPFVSIGFHQRQFQSVDSSYAGFSFGGGAEYGWSEGTSLKAQARYLLLNGPSNATANQIDILFGVSFGL